MLEFVNSWMLGLLCPILLIIGGMFYSFKLKFFYLTKPKKLLSSFASEKGSGASSFRALMLALAGTLGVGNIVGVSAAIYMGGFGAVFWMWVSALCAAVLKYAEITLGMRHRRFDAENKPHGAAMYYVKDCFCSLGLKRLGGALAAVFAVFCVINSVTMGSVIQTDAVAGALEGAFRIPRWVTAGAVAILAFVIVKKGSDGISRFTEKLVPLMTLGYIILSVAVIVLRADRLGDAFASIFKSAFSFRAAGSGALGFVFSRSMRYGVMRGLISNEAGCGTAPAAHAVSESKSPARQGVWGMAEVFIDTMLLCTLTALAVIVEYGEAAAYGGNFIMMTLSAYSSALGDFAMYFMSIAVLCFGFATVICWAHYGLESVRYLSERRGARTVFTAVYCLSVFLGAFASAELIWQSADLAVGVMTVINVTVLFLMSGEVKRETELYFK